MEDFTITEETTEDSEKIDTLIPYPTENAIKVYVRLDENKVIKEINSSIFLQDITNYIEIDEGHGDKYAHAQSQYLEKGLLDNKGRFNYKFDSMLLELTEEEKETLFPILPPQPSEIEILQAKLNSATQQLDFQEELIVELAMMVYQ